MAEICQFSKNFLRNHRQLIVANIMGGGNRDTQGNHRQPNTSNLMGGGNHDAPRKPSTAYGHRNNGWMDGPSKPSLIVNNIMVGGTGTLLANALQLFAINIMSGEIWMSQVYHRQLITRHHYWKVPRKYSSMPLVEETCCYQQCYGRKNMGGSKEIYYSLL